MSLQIDFRRRCVMAIVNVTPDSFFGASRAEDAAAVERMVRRAVAEGSAIIDIGGCSTRPGSIPPSMEEEWDRVSAAFSIVREIDEKIPVSIDTYRAKIVRKCIAEFGDCIINDISGGSLDEEMWETAINSRVPYILTHMRGNPTNMNDLAKYHDVTSEVISELSWKIYELRKNGLNDIIIDPGIGFAKTSKQNFELLNELQEFTMIGVPIMIGISRKSFISNTLKCDSAGALDGTIALDAIALYKGADIIRVHDVKEAKETVKLISELKNG